MSRPIEDVLRDIHRDQNQTEDVLATIQARLGNLETRIRHFEVIEERAAREEEQRERALAREIENERRRQGR